jgi:hypothetical protein
MAAGYARGDYAPADDRIVHKDRNVRLAVRAGYMFGRRW